MFCGDDKECMGSVVMIKNYGFCVDYKGFMDFVVMIKIVLV